MQQESGMVAEYKFDGYVVEENGEMTAYFRMNSNPAEKELLLREITDVDQATAHSVLGFLKDTGRKLGPETLVATISYEEPFTKHMVATGEARQLPPYAWQLRVMDYVRMFRKMKTLFEKRLAKSTYRRLTEKLSFNFYRFTVQMVIEDGVVSNVQRLETNEDRTIRASPLVFTQMLFAHRSREELQRIYPDFMVHPSHQHLVDVLFPKLPSYIHCAY
jgi:hypothetical protein